MEAHAEELGPVDIVVIAYPADAPMTGEAVPILLDLVERGIIRVLDVMFVVKEQDGTYSGFEATDLDSKGVGDFAVFEGASSGLLGDEDVAAASDGIEPGLGGGHPRLREPLGGAVRRCRPSQRRHARRIPARARRGSDRVARGRRGGGLTRKENPMPGLLRGMARTAVVAGTATAASNRVSRRQANRWAAQEQQTYEPPPQQYARRLRPATAPRTRSSSSRSWPP